MLNSLSKRRLHELKTAFDFFDKNKDGRISYKELAEIISSLGDPVSERDVRECILEVDLNGDGYVDFEEFVNMMTKKPVDEIEMMMELRKTFRLFDKNGDGQISVQELRESLWSLGEEISEEEAREMIQEADVDGDGYINFEEFARVMVI
jgi:Ca2+-binding protein (EF-Hand superfamily)